MRALLPFLPAITALFSLSVSSSPLWLDSSFNMSSTTAPERKNIIYPIPGSTLILDIILNESKTLPTSIITALLDDVKQKASENPQSDTVEGAFRRTTPDAEAVEGKRAEFGVRGGPIVNELTWHDVSTIAEGLKGWYEKEQQWVSLIFYLDDEKRGALGDGYLEPVDASAATV